MSFVFVSGNLALDFAATLKWRRTEPEELLATPDDAARWAVEAGVVTAAPVVDAAELRRLRALREAVYRLFTAEPWRAADLRAVNRAAAADPVRVALTPRGVRRSGDAAAVGAGIAVAAIELLGAPERDLVRECGRDACTRLFVDRSRGGSRTWCGMEECGNRIKAAAYRARLRTAQDPQVLADRSA